jgi:hypothetical protein
VIKKIMDDHIHLIGYISRPELCKKDLNQILYMLYYGLENSDS